jgi:hypothetical protein
MELRLLLPTFPTRVPDSDLDGSVQVFICVAGFPDPNRIQKTDPDHGVQISLYFLGKNINDNTSKMISFNLPYIVQDC